MSYVGYIYMSAPTLKCVEDNSYTHGPAPWSGFHPDVGEFIVIKNRRGHTVAVEAWDGEELPIPNTHTRVFPRME